MKRLQEMTAEFFFLGNPIDLLKIKDENMAVKTGKFAIFINIMFE